MWRKAALQRAARATTMSMGHAVRNTEPDAVDMRKECSAFKWAVLMMP